MEDKKKTFKEWCKEHKDNIISGAINLMYYAGGLAIGYFVGDKIRLYKDGATLDALYDSNIIKCFDPETGLEIHMSKVVEVAKKTWKK